MNELVQNTTTQNVSDASLIEATLKDKQQYGALVRKYQAPLMRYVKRITRLSNDDVEAIVQDTFIKAYINIRNFDTKLKFSSWLYRIAHNTAISELRSRNRSIPVSELESSSSSEEGGLDEILFKDEAYQDIAVDEKDAIDAITKALPHLSEAHRSILILRFFEGKEYSEIADILQKPIGTVSTLIYRAKQALKEHIDHERLR
jgi:RNA polymerase sigma-70 factor, ECF subfamily